MTTQPWVDGLWYSEESTNMITEVKGQQAFFRNLVELDHPDFEPQPMEGTWTHGTFHETLKEIEDRTGAKNYNIEMSYENGTFRMFGVLDEDGESIAMCNMLNYMDTMRLLTPEKRQEILDARAHADEIIPPGFTPQPNEQGKILFLSGPPGAGTKDQDIYNVLKIMISSIF